MQVKINHPSLGPQKTRLSSDVAALATTSTVENTQGFATDDYGVFGLPGEELTEIKILTSVSASTTIEQAALSFAHAARTAVSQIKYNQAKIYTSTSEEGTYALLTTVDLTLDQDATYYEDSTGTSSTWYKIKYYNENGATLSSYSVAVQGTGYTEDSRKSMVEEIMADFGDEDGEDLKKAQVHRYLRAGVRKVTAELIKMYPDYRKSYAAQALSSGTASLPTRFISFFRVDAGTTAATAYKAKYVSESELYPNTTYSSYEPKVFIRESSFYIEPSTIANAYLWYWDYPADMTTDSAEHGLPYGARDVLVAYGLWRAWLSKDVDVARSFNNMYEDSLEDYLVFVGQSRQTITRGMVDVKSGTDLYES